MAKKLFKIKNTLAEALDDTISSAINNAGELHIEIIPLRKITLDLENPRDLALTIQDLYQGLQKTDPDLERKKQEKENLLSLSKSILDQGVINPIVVYKENNNNYKLIAGERRTLASILAQKEDIPARILTSKPEALKLTLLQWIENIEREDLSLWERMRNLEKILIAYSEKKNKNPDNITPTELTELLGCSLQQSVNYRHLLNSSKELKFYIQKGDIKNIEKAALIAKSPLVIQEQLIQSALLGATLSQLKKLAREILDNNNYNNINNYNISQKEKVNFGSTDNLKVAKIIIDIIKNNITNINNIKINNLIKKDLDLTDHRSASLTFREIIKSLEEIN